ncbi:protein of unknown function [Bradyrhizobium sp. ORS 285]|nr:hypothetical protein BRAO285_880008 [Bradyrhizobium sp. ORS 285]SMX61272.1 protein of unknown function [Bradyrhizobium sp. ORS 285]
MAARSLCLSDAHTSDSYANMNRESPTKGGGFKLQPPFALANVRAVTAHIRKRLQGQASHPIQPETRRLPRTQRCCSAPEDDRIAVAAIVNVSSGSGPTGAWSQSPLLR